MRCWRWLRRPRCRRQTLLAYSAEASEPTAHCDLCQEGVELFDGTVDAQKAMSAILRPASASAWSICAILVGERTDNVLKFNHDACRPRRRRGSQAAEWRSIFRQLSATA